MLVVSFKANEAFFNFLEENNISYIKTTENANLDLRIADHPDLSIFPLDKDDIVVASEVYDYYKENLSHKNIIRGEEVSRKYPQDAIYNIVKFKDYYIHNDHTEKTVEKYFKDNKISHLPVKQGYTRCSTIVLKESILTADYGIYKALKDKVRVILLSEDIIKLDGFDKGFIGGTCGLIGDELIFTGDIRKHKSYDLIKKECERENIDIIYPETELVDLGSLININ
ncbi:DUF6873 family GME fold protein [Anaerococcus vaginimassiliensis]|uniref:DUF6873 family GME fold protein n=1 Tax=Anaerococcus vaginimassiliensis TaxID=2042308 RepID=UPI0010308D9A|nr:hypothetical protein [Anaerococcus vaginimassiliensis]